MMTTVDKCYALGGLEWKQSKLHLTCHLNAISCRDELVLISLDSEIQISNYDWQLESTYCRGLFSSRSFPVTVLLIQEVATASF